MSSPIRTMNCSILTVTCGILVSFARFSWSRRSIGPSLIWQPSFSPLKLAPVDCESISCRDFFDATQPSLLWPLDKLKPPRELRKQASYDSDIVEQKMRANTRGFAVTNGLLGRCNISVAFLKLLLSHGPSYRTPCSYGKIIFQKQHWVRLRLAYLQFDLFVLRCDLSDPSLTCFCCLWEKYTAPSFLVQFSRWSQWRLQVFPAITHPSLAVLRGQ